MVQLLDVLVARVADGLPSEVKAGVQGALTTLASHRLVSSLLHALGPAHGAEPAASRVAALRSSARSAGTHALAQPPSRLVAQALVHERAFDMAAAARCLESAVATSSDGWLETSEGVDALCRLAKQRSDSGWQSYAAHHGLPFCSAALPAPGALSLAEGAALIADSVALCDDALRLAPHSGRAHMAAAVATGRAALFTADLRARVRMCNRIRALAEQALVLDPVRLRRGSGARRMQHRCPTHSTTHCLFRRRTGPTTSLAAGTSRSRA